MSSRSLEWTRDTWSEKILTITDSCCLTGALQFSRLQFTKSGVLKKREGLDSWKQNGNLGRAS